MSSELNIEQEETGVPPIPPSGAPIPHPTGIQPPIGGIKPPIGGIKPPIGGIKPPTGIQPPLGATKPPTGIQPPVGAIKPPMGGIKPPIGAPIAPMERIEPPTAAPAQSLTDETDPSLVKNDSEGVPEENIVTEETAVEEAPVNEETAVEEMPVNEETGVEEMPIPAGVEDTAKKVDAFSGIGSVTGEQNVQAPPPAEPPVTYREMSEPQSFDTQREQDLMVREQDLITREQNVLVREQRVSEMEQQYSAYYRDLCEREAQCAQDKAEIQTVQQQLNAQILEIQNASAYYGQMQNNFEYLYKVVTESGLLACGFDENGNIQCYPVNNYSPR